MPSETSSAGYKYKGTHWTQKPENRARLLKMLSKPRRRKGVKLSKAERVVAKLHATATPRTTRAPETSIVANGWRVTMGHDSIKIERSR